MENELPVQPSPKSRGLPVWTVLVALVVLIAICGGALIWIYSARFSPDEIVKRQEQERILAETEKKRQEERNAEKDKLDRARNRQEEVLAQVRIATNTLEKLLTQTRQVMSEVGALKTNDTGRGVALHPDLVLQARNFYDRDLRDMPSLEEIVAKVEGARRIEQQMLSALGTSFMPGADLVVSAQNAGLWADQELRRVGQLQTLASAMVRDSKIKVTDAKLTPNSPTLEAAIRNLSQDEAATRQQKITEAEAKERAAAIIAEAEARAKALEERARADREREANAAKLEIENTRREAQELADKMRREAEQAKADSLVKDKQAQVEVEKQKEEARRVVFRQKASDPDVQTKLAPFITPGYWSPNGMTVEKKAHSYTMLQNYGALTPTDAGLQKLVNIAFNLSDKVRPRWKLRGSMNYWRSKPEDVEMVKEAQKLLIELGPVLVEQKMLEP